MTAFPIGQYDLIMADSPWSFATYSAKGQGKSADTHYATRDLRWISELPVASIAAPDCLLWLWATNPMLPPALTMLRYWGFTFKTAGHWSKRNLFTGKLAFGTGYILRCAGEPFLIGTRGNPKTTRSVRSVIEGARRQHSRKPEEAFTAAEQLMPSARRIELFSRQERAGWDVWGDQIDRFPAPAAMSQHKGVA
ncbi:MT-A70 family methyltransferase [Ketogulonicigenium vulgare]|uniref:MT-A70 family methyltransferase n=1 Tax=Ketogulonicigenium vulgare TaxID=92945 RepID=UPI0023593878|nr:MT-A70 family methyltransferase [Ketogulonicigenium vulgare]